MWKFPTKKPWFRWMGVSRRSCVNAWRTRPGKPGPFPLSALGATWRWPGVMGKEGHGTSIPINLGIFDDFFFKIYFLKICEGISWGFRMGSNDTYIYIYTHTYDILLSGDDSRVCKLEDKHVSVWQSSNYFGAIFTINLNFWVVVEFRAINGGIYGRSEIGG